MPDLFLGASAYPTATGQRQPMPRVEPERNRSQQQHRSRNWGSSACDDEPEQSSGGASRPGRDGVRQPAVLLAAHVVQARP